MSFTARSSKPCKFCGGVGHSAFNCPHKPRKPLKTTTTLKPRKPMKLKGKKTIEYETWRDTFAKPYLDEHYGHKCTVCGTETGLQVDHIKNRSTHPHLVMVLSNVQYLCNTHHYMKTYRIKEAQNAENYQRGL